MWSFLSCFEPHFHRKISFHSYAKKTNFLVKSFALSLAFIMGFKAARKCPIIIKFGERGFDFFQELLMFCEVISNTRKSVSSYLQTIQSWLKKKGCASLFSKPFLGVCKLDEKFFLLFDILPSRKMVVAQNSFKIL